MIELLLFLGSLGCSPRIEVVADPALDRPARQQGALDRPARQQGALVRVRTSDPGVLLHELWHVCQEQARGPAATDDESARREAEAHTVELIWRQRDR